MALRYAKSHGYNFIEHKADWGQYGKKSGYLRNIEIWNSADEGLAFWNEQTEKSGTFQNFKIAMNQGKPLAIWSLVKHTWIRQDGLPSDTLPCTVVNKHRDSFDVYIGRGSKWATFCNEGQF
jgi:hypothetical protein